MHPNFGERFMWYMRKYGKLISHQFIDVLFISSHQQNTVLLPAFGQLGGNSLGFPLSSSKLPSGKCCFQCTGKGLLFRTSPLITFYSSHLINNNTSVCITEYHILHNLYINMFFVTLRWMLAGWYFFMRVAGDLKLHSCLGYYK